MRKASFVILSLAFAAAILSPLTTTAADESLYTYTVANGKATITYFNRTYSGALEIASTLGGFPVTTIGQYAFYNTSLTSVTIPASIISIGTHAFNGCTALTSVTIPVSFISIGYAAFSGCPSLASITVDPANPNCSSLDGVLFNKTKTRLDQCPGGKTGAYTIPASVTKINMNAFSGCSSLTSVTIPSSVTTLGDLAFRSCTSLSSVYFAGNAQKPGSDMFASTSATVYYLPGTTGWVATYAGRPTKLWNPAFTGTTLSAGAISCTVTGSPSIPIAMETTTNLAIGPWVRLCTTNITNNSITLHNPDSSSHPARFYRLVGP